MSQLVQFGLQSAFRESIGSGRGFRARFASQLVQFGTSERVSQIILSQSFDSDGNLGARIANHFISNHLIQMGTSERVSQIILSQII